MDDKDAIRTIAAPARTLSSSLYISRAYAQAAREGGSDAENWNVTHSSSDQSWLDMTYGFCSRLQQGKQNVLARPRDEYLRTRHSLSPHSVQVPRSGSQRMSMMLSTVFIGGPFLSPVGLF